MAFVLLALLHHDSWLCSTRGRFSQAAVCQTDCAYWMLQVMDMLLSDLARFKLVEDGAETFTRNCQGVWQTQHPGEPVSKVECHFTFRTPPPALRQGFATPD